MLRFAVVLGIGLALSMAVADSLSAVTLVLPSFAATLGRVLGLVFMVDLGSLLGFVGFDLFDICKSDFELS